MFIISAISPSSPVSPPFVAFQSGSSNLISRKIETHFFLLFLNVLVVEIKPFGRDSQAITIQVKDL